MSGMLGPGDVVFTSNSNAVATFWIKHDQIVIWDISASNRLAQLKYQPGGVCSRLSPDGTRVAFEGTNQTIIVQEITNQNSSVRLALAKHRPCCLTFSPNGQWLAAIDAVDDTWIWDSRTGKLLRTFPRPAKDFVSSIAFSHDGKLIALSAQDLQVRRLDSWDEVLCIKSPSMKAGSRVAGVFFMLAAAFGAHPIVTDAVAGRMASGPAVFSPDDKHVAVINSAADLGNALGLSSMQVRVFNVEGKDQISTFDQGDTINAVCFSPDGRRVCSAGIGVEVWDWQSGKIASAPTQPSPLNK